MPLYAGVIFLSAFLLFQVQPLIARYILPWFGGAPAVWTTCMLFFQVLLLAGYAYAHLLSDKLQPRRQAAIHLLLLAASLLFLPIALASAWTPAAGQSAVADILLMLLVSIGGPYLVLSTTGPLLQRWFSRTAPGVSPYRLYALSNVGSLLALISYPVLFEPNLTLHQQSLAWSALYATFVGGCAFCAARLARALPAEASTAPAPVASGSEPASPRPGLRQWLCWISLSALGAVLLLAGTNQICQDVAVVPFLWVLPLSLYLLTFVLCFDRERWSQPSWFALLAALGVLAAWWALRQGDQGNLLLLIAAHGLALFALCMVCHGLLVSSKPAAEHLTAFYLAMSGGGALGGILVAIAAPLLFSSYLEYPLALAAGAVAAAATLLGKRRAVWPQGPPPLLRLPVALLLAALTLLLGFNIVFSASGRSADPKMRTIAMLRNFYGALRVEETAGYRQLLHGQITHGLQYLDPKRKGRPTGYYTPASGIGLAILRHPRRAAADPGQRHLRVGVIGLGAGTMAALAQDGDEMRFYEINPQVIDLAQEHFTFLRDSPAKVTLALGDARLVLEEEVAKGQGERYDVLAVDAFTGDAVPVHLLTGQCGELYRRRLAAGGILALHISNKYLDLLPVVRGLAGQLGLQAVEIAVDARWVLLSNNPAFLQDPAVVAAAVALPADSPPPLLWTDDFSSLWQVLARRPADQGQR